MTSAPSAYRGFACPKETLDLHELDALSARHSARHARSFLERFHDKLIDQADGLESVLTAFAENPPAFETCWHPTVGQLKFVDQGKRALGTAVGLALYLGERRPGSWSARLDYPQAFRFDSYELPKASRLLFESSSERACVEIEQAGTVKRFAFSLEAGTWHSDSLKPALSVRMGRSSVPILERLPEPLSLPEGLVLAAAPDEATRSGYADTYSLVVKFAVLYSSWVRRAIRCLLPLESPANATCSNSFEFLPGLVALSRTAPALALAELLVHEASHQYFFMLTEAGPVDDGSDKNLYYSPARRMKRPIDKILLAYHAVGNIVLFYRMCRANSIEESAPGASSLSAREEQSLGKWLDELRRPLETTRALTPLGRALFEPLALHLDTGS